MSYTVKVKHIPEDHSSGYRLGRHYEFDSRSENYLVWPKTVSGTTVFTPVTWFTADGVPVLDQGDVGACTGFALADALGKAVLKSTIPAAVVIDNALGLSFYHDNTVNDSIRGTYPPTDTGSSSVAVGKTAVKRGLASGYLHITTAAALATAIQSGPVIVGTNWYNSMFEPNSKGQVVVTKSSGLAGGHEYVLDSVTTDGYFGFTNSWGTSFGVKGRFYIKQTEFLTLLNDDGDAISLVPVNQPAPVPGPPPAPVPVPEPTPVPVPTPTPVPVPVPVPVPTPDFDVVNAYKSLQKWAARNGIA